jgi:hypothetical protein
MATAQVYGTLRLVRLSRLRLVHVGAFDDTTVSFSGEEAPRPLAVVFGGDGTGKTTLLSAIAHTRPGHALPPIPHPRPGGASGPAFVLADWTLGDDDPARPHPLVVASPSAVVEGETEAQTIVRRREQALFDKRAQEHGFAFAAISGARWFSRTSVMLSSPERSVVRYDPRAAATFDDATRADLTRETKQIFSYAAIAHALEARTEAPHVTHLDEALREIAAVFLEPFALRYEGADPRTLEPIFQTGRGESATFDDLPKGARHLLAIGAIAARALFSAYDGDESIVREREGVIVVDDIEAQQDAALLRHLPALLVRALPRVQWILTTASTAVTMGCDRGEVLALRRAGDTLELHEGPLATLH